MPALALALIGIVALGQVPSRSVYTRLDQKSCKVVESHEELGWTVQKCRGFGGFDLLVLTADDREDVRIVHAKEEDELGLDNVTTWFNSVGEVVEWRVVGKRPVALILRLVVDDSDGPDRLASHHFLIVVRVRPANSCVVEVLDTRVVPDTNSRARRSADGAQSKGCLWQ